MRKVLLIAPVLAVSMWLVKQSLADGRRRSPAGKAMAKSASRERNVKGASFLHYAARHPRPQRLPGGINQFIMYGQSLSTGQQTAPALSVDNYDGNLMLGDQVWSNFNNNLDSAGLIFNPLTARPTLASHKTNAEVLADTTIDASNQINCEPPVIGFTNALKAFTNRSASLAKEVKFAATSSGEGGRSIELLMKACPNRNGIYYNHVLKMMRRSVVAAARMKEKVRCAAVLWMQGEYNYTKATNQGWQAGTPATGDKAEYKQYFARLVNDISEDAQSIYQQAQPPVFMTYQCGAQFTKDFNVSIGMAQLEAAHQDPRIVMAGPVYPVTDRGGHLCPNGSRWYGEMMAKVYYKTVIRGERWTALQPKSISAQKRYVDIRFTIPKGPLKLDTLTLRKVKDYGFGLKENGIEKKISAVRIVNGKMIRLEVESEFTGGPIEVNYAGPATAGNGNVCDSDDFVSFNVYQELVAGGSTPKQQNRFKPTYEPKDRNGKVIYGQPYPLQNFSCAFYYLLPEGTRELKCF